MAGGKAIARALARSERAQVKAAIKAGDELGYNRNYTRGLVKFGQEGMTPEARMARAREMGFDTETPLYHGTNASFPAFDVDAPKRYDAGWYGRGVYTSVSPDEASAYATKAGRLNDGGTPNVIPVLRRGATSFNVEDGGTVGEIVPTFLDATQRLEGRPQPLVALNDQWEAAKNAASSRVERRIVDEASLPPEFQGVVQTDGKGGAVVWVDRESNAARFFPTQEAAVSNIAHKSYLPNGFPLTASEVIRRHIGPEKFSSLLRDNGFRGIEAGDEIVALNASDLRSPNATFDPARANRRDLLAATIPATAALGAGAVAMQPGEAEAAPVGAIRNALRTGDALGYERAYSRALVKGLDTSPEARLARARAQGYQPFYKGMNEPYRDTGESLGWAGANPRVASTYAVSGEGANVMPLMVRTGDLPTVEGGGRLFDEIPRENIPPVLRDRLSPNYAPVPADMAQAAFEAGQPGVRINNVIDDNVNTFDLTQRTPTDTVQRWPVGRGQRETGYRSRFAMFDPARAGRSDIMAGVVPATVALGGAVAGAAALAPQDAEAAFIGPRGAANLYRAGDQAALNSGAVARALARRNVPREQVWNQTGWYKGVDGKWRTEIDDSRAVLTDKVGDGIRDNGIYQGTLSDALEHQEFFGAYPELADEAASIGVQRRSSGQRRRGTVDGERLPGMTVVYGPNAGAQRSTLLHEGQHGAQDFEGFARGGSNTSAFMSDEMRPKWWAEVQRRLTPPSFEEFAANSTFDGVDPAEVRRQYDNMVASLDEARRDPYNPLSKSAQESAAQDMYRRLAGEVEARNVQRRLYMTPAERRAKPPWETQDIPDDQQIVRFGGGTAQSAPEPSALARALARQLPEFNRAVDTSLDIASITDPSLGYVTETARALKDLPGKIQGGPFEKAAGTIALAPLTGATSALASIGQLPEAAVNGYKAVSRALARAKADADARARDEAVYGKPGILYRRGK